MSLQALQTQLMVVEDNTNVAKAVCHLASKLGFITEHHPTASSFRQSPITTLPQAIILDLKLPDADGISLLDHIQTHFASCGIIIMSGMDPSVIHATGQLIQTRGLHLIGTLHKPFHLKELKQLLTQVRGERRHQRRPADTEAETISPRQLREAIKQQQFVPFYQAQTTSIEGKVVGFEALMRWIHPQWGVVAPARFIGLAAQHQLLDQMTWVMLEQVAIHWQQLQWRKTTVSVNLPASFLNQDQLPEKIIRLITNYGLDPSQLMLEITESEALQDLPHQLNNLIRLRLAGFPLSIDDFGTGYSSLISLYQIPFQELKIDQTFVMRADSDPVAMEIIHTLVFLTRRLKINLIAEGVETEHIREILVQAGVERIQGYLVHKPMAFEHLQSWREQYQPTTIPSTSAPSLPSETLLSLSQQSLTMASGDSVIKLMEALRNQHYDDNLFRPIFSSIFAAGESISSLLSLLLRSEWLLLQQAMPQIQKLPDAEQYHAIRQQLDFFERLRQLVVEVKENAWQQRLEHAEKSAHTEHLNRILAENSIIWLRRGKVKIITYLDEVPIQSLAKVINVIGHVITVELNEELAKVLAVHNYHATITTQNRQEQIAIEALRIEQGKAHLTLGEVADNLIGKRHHVRVRYPEQPQATLTLQGQPAIEGHIIDLSISGAKLALPPQAQSHITKHATIQCKFTIGEQEVSGKGTVRWLDHGSDESLQCGITLSGNANDQRLIQEETLQLQRNLISQLGHTKLPVLLRSALEEISTQPST